MLSTLVIVLIASFAPLVPQDPGQANRPPLLKLDELEILQVQPKHLDVYELEELVVDMVGREFYVVERGGYTSTPVSNVRVLGSGLIFYDTDVHLKQMLSAVAQLDQPRAEPAQAEPEFEPLVTMHYVPRFLSLDAVLKALGSFHREPYDGEDYVDNFSRSRERNLLVIRETAARLKEIRTVLERIDVPAQQIVVTCQLIRGELGGEDSGVADELLTNLKAMLPGMSFRSAGFSMLQSSVMPERQVNMQLQDDTGGVYALSFHPIAYDHKTASLSVVQCKMEDRTDQPRTLFTTSTIFRGGEYTVLGATGANPLFAVVRVQPVSG